MGRITRVLGFSVPPDLAEEVEAIAAREGTSKSELFRRMVDVYKRSLAEAEFFALQSKMSRRARQPRAFTEKEIEKIVFEDR